MKKQVPISLLSSLLLFCLVGCQNVNSTQRKDKIASDSPIVPSNTIVPETTDSILEKDKKLIMGNWVPSDEKEESDLLTFTNDKQILWSSRDSVKTVSSYTLSYKSCEGNENKDHSEYLKVTDDDGSEMCFVITGIDKKNLAMMYVSGNGTISTYRRSKKFK